MPSVFSGTNLIWGHAANTHGRIHGWAVSLEHTMVGSIQLRVWEDAHVAFVHNGRLIELPEDVKAQLVALLPPDALEKYVLWRMLHG